MQNKDWKQFSLEIFELQNKIRQNPKFMIPHLEKALSRFNGNVLLYEDGGGGVETQEGQTPYVEAIEYLR